MYIENVKSPKDIKSLGIEQLNTLSEEIRKALIVRLSKRGGHVGPNLGMVEATIAMHYVFNSPIDKIVFDVSHQCYTHKMLTGRAEAYLDPTHYGDVSGYTNPEESEHDFFNIGHTSTSVSLACGLAKARDLKGETGNIIAVIGDGSLSGGEAFEGLSNAGTLNSNMIIVVNDNEMSIAENHGGLYENLAQLRQTNGTTECNFFKSLSLDYRFLADGNNISELIKIFHEVKDCSKPTVVHICTQKGKGLSYAEENREKYHFSGPFDIATGKGKHDNSEVEDYNTITGKIVIETAANNPRFVAITSGTPGVFGLNSSQRQALGSQFIDVGIAEEHAVAVASGLASAGCRPLWAVYSSFIQRTYDQMSQDLCINNNPAVICVFAASVYGMNDVTHLGIFDIPLLGNIPNLVYLAPTCKEEYIAMLNWAVAQQKHPVAIRVPAHVTASDVLFTDNDYSNLNRYQKVETGERIAIIALGSFYSLGRKTAVEIERRTGIHPTLINPRYISGLDSNMLNEIKSSHDIIITLEDGILDGGFGEKIARFYGNSNIRTLCYGIRKEFIDRYNVNELLKENRLTPEQITEDIEQLL